MIQSPSFLYIPLLGEETADGSGFWKLDGYEIASRLSFFLVGRTPDEALLDAAEAGELDEEDGIRAWAEALLETVGRTFVGKPLMERTDRKDEIAGYLPKPAPSPPSLPNSSRKRGRKPSRSRAASPPPRTFCC